MIWSVIILTFLAVCGQFGRIAGDCSRNHGKTHCIAEDLLQVLVGFKSSSGKDTSTRPTFFASLKKHPLTLSGINSILVFEDVRINRGNGYDKNTGIFKAPRKGLYHFSCLILGQSGHAVHYQLNKNDAVYTAGYSAKGAYIASTLSVIMELKRSDRVYIKHRSSRAEQVYGNHFSTFAGHFLYE